MTSKLINDYKNGNADTVPTVCYVHHETGKIHVGKAALEMATMSGSAPQNLLHSFKRLLAKR